jgi:hypothetical protein
MREFLKITATDLDETLTEAVLLNVKHYMFLALLDSEIGRLPLPCLSHSLTFPVNQTKFNFFRTIRLPFPNMTSADADQFLDLIAENAQIKAEIMSLRQFAGLVREFDQSLIRVCTQSVLNSHTSDQDFASLLSKIKQGIPPVESAESFKQRMVAERSKRLCDTQRGKLNEFEEKIAQSEHRKSEMLSTIQ